MRAPGTLRVFCGKAGSSNRTLALRRGTRAQSERPEGSHHLSEQALRHVTAFVEAGVNIEVHRQDEQSSRAHVVDSA